MLINEEIDSSLRGVAKWYLKESKRWNISTWIVKSIFGHAVLLILYIIVDCKCIVCRGYILIKQLVVQKIDILHDECHLIDIYIHSSYNTYINITILLVI